MSRQTPRLLILALVALLVSGPAWAVEYECPVTHKLDSERIYSQQKLNHDKFAVKIDDRGPTATLSRCSLSSIEKKVTCDRYVANKIVFDENVKIKKFYVFRSHFDVQLFSNLKFIENNGRGSISFGKCNIASP